MTLRTFTLVLGACALVSVAGCTSCRDTAEVPAAEGSDGSATPPAEPAPGSEGSGSEAAPDPAAEAPVEMRPAVERRPEVEAGRALAAQLGLAPPDPLLVADLLTRADVRELTRFEGELLETSLEGIPPSPDYNALRLQAGAGYGFALQMWRFNEVRQVTDQFRRLRETYFDAQLDTSGVGNEAFKAEFEGIRHYAFLHRATKSTVVVTCDAALCDDAQIRALAQRAANRL